MAKQGSNKGIYIFWGGIAIILVVTLLIIFLPRTNTRQVYVNMETSISVQSTTDKYGNSFDDYITKLMSKLSTPNQQLTNLNTMKKAVTLSNDFNLDALNFVENKKDFKKLASEQQSALNSVKEKTTSLQTYFTTSLHTLLEGGTEPTTLQINEALGVVLPKYTEIMQIWSTYYKATAELLYLNATLCIEVNEPMLAQHLELMMTIKTEMQNAVINTTVANNALTQAEKIYAFGYNRGLVV